MDAVSKKVCAYLLPVNFIKLTRDVFNDLSMTLGSTLARCFEPQLYCSLRDIRTVEGD